MIFRIDMKRLTLITGFLLLCSYSLLVQAELFPRPPGLQPNIDFWKRVYTEIDRSQGFLHDERDLSIVYGAIKVPANGSRRARKRIVKQEKAKLRKTLYRIAEKPANELTGRDRQIRRLFREQATAREIKAAAGKIRFQLGQADKFRSALNKSGVYMPYIRRQFAEAGLPVELSTLPFVESSFNIAAHSHVGAAGIWQFMPGTGRRFMKVNHVIDERYDPYRATEAAIRLLQYNHDILDSWPLALTAYNHGVAGMRRAVRRTGSSDIGVIAGKYKSRTFGFASRNFYAEFIAALDVSSDPQRYFPGVHSQSPFDYTVFTLDHYVPAETLAQSLGITVDMLEKHNLALREPVWEGEKHLPARYELRVPRELVAGEISSLLAVIPDSARHARQVPDKTYRVRRGDSLSRIAGLYGISVSDLVMMNNLRSRHRIRAGQVLFLPQKGVPVTPPLSSPVVVASAAPVSVIKTPVADEGPGVVIQPGEAGEHGEDMAADDAASGHEQLEATDPADYSVAQDDTIEIQAMETLGHYADWLGLRTSRLRKLNRVSFRKPLVMGKRLKLDFSQVNRERFVQSREEYHKELEDAFFAVSQIEGTREYRIQRGDSLWKITSKRADLPLWLIRQYNPDTDFSSLKPGEKIVIPVAGKKAAS